MINCILLVLLLLVSMVLLKCTNSPLIVHFLNFVRFFHLKVPLIIFLPISFVILFVINSKFYNQIDGAAVGSPLAPFLANIFMGFYDSKWLNEYNLKKPKFYLRYVDGILAAFDKKQDLSNSQIH